MTDSVQDAPESVVQDLAAQDLADAECAGNLRPGHRPRCEAQDAGPLTVRVTASLKSKLADLAHEEGVAVEALVQELLSESVTLRAWEIIERKAAMRSNQGQSQPGGGGNNRGFNRNQGGGNNPQNGGPRGRPGPNQPRRNTPPNNNWMEDKAAFLEYVRNQEKRGR